MGRTPQNQPRHLNQISGTIALSAIMRKAERVAPRPVQLGHEFEVHAVDARDQGWRNADHRHDGQGLEQIVLLDGDEAEHRIEQELHLVRQMLLKGVERGDILADRVEPVANSP